MDDKQFAPLMNRFKDVNAGAKCREAIWGNIFVFLGVRAQDERADTKTENEQSE
jgi:hypothetical protein